MEVELKRLSAKVGKRGTEVAVLIRDSFNEEEFDELCFTLGIDPEHVQGETMVTRPFQLVNLCHRRGLTDDLHRVLAEMRPHIDW